jgi:hypothetical protein
VSRIGRLHWLSGRRSAVENWDAFEAPSGIPMLTSGAAEWPLLRHQLRDLSDELASASEDGTLPPLALDRLWIRDDGRMILLDFPAPGVQPSLHADLTPAKLLALVIARLGPGAGPDRIPLSARLLRDRWTRAAPPSLEDARAALAAAAVAPDRVHTWRRALPIAVSGAPVVLMLLSALLIIPALGRFASADTTQIMNMLGALQKTDWAPPTLLAKPGVRGAMETYLAGHYRDVIRDDDFWGRGVVRGLAADYRPLAQEILQRHPDVSASEAEEARVFLQTAREGDPSDQRGRGTGIVELSGDSISTLTAAGLVLVFALSVLSSALVPGGIITRQLGLAVVTRAGSEIGRVRSVLRVLVAGAPAIAWFLYLARAPKIRGFVPAPSSPLLATAIVISLLAAGALWTIARRIRGPHDLVLRTWVVPR